MSRIRYVKIFQDKDHRIRVRYENGAAKSYDRNMMPKTALDFISQENVKAFENGSWTLYQEVTA